MRGPKPWQLSRLFRLMYEEGIRDTKTLAETLRIKRTTLYTYKWRLKRRFLKIVEKSLHDFDTQTLCPECLEPSMRRDHETGELVCTRCGLVAKQTQNFSVDLPFNTTYALTSNLAFGKSLGGTLNYRGTLKVLAKAHHEGSQIPIRQIQTIIQTVDPPVVKRMLSYGSKMLKELGMDRDTDSCHIFADRYGRLLRKIGAFIQISKTEVPPYIAARAALFYLLINMDREKALEARKKYPFGTKYLEFVMTLDKLWKEYK